MFHKINNHKANFFFAGIDVVVLPQKFSEDETIAIDKICKEEVNSYVLFDPEVINCLYRRGGVYFDVPVYPEDRFRGMESNQFVLLFI